MKTLKRRNGMKSVCSLKHCKNCGKPLGEKRQGNYCSPKCYLKANPKIYKKVLEHKKEYLAKQEVIEMRKAWYEKNKTKLRKYIKNYRRRQRREEKEIVNSKEYIKLRCKIHQDWFKKHGYKDVAPTIIDEHKIRYANAKKTPD